MSRHPKFVALKSCLAEQAAGRDAWHGIVFGAWVVGLEGVSMSVEETGWVTGEASGGLQRRTCPVCGMPGLHATDGIVFGVQVRGGAQWGEVGAGVAACCLLLRPCCFRLPLDHLPLPPSWLSD